MLEDLINHAQQLPAYDLLYTWLPGRLHIFFFQRGSVRSSMFFIEPTGTLSFEVTIIRARLDKPNQVLSILFRCEGIFLSSLFEDIDASNPISW